MNDVLVEELRNVSETKEVKIPTPVMFFNVLKNKNRLKIHKEGKTILLDSGSSHSIITQRLVYHFSWKRTINPLEFDICGGKLYLTHKTKVTLS